MRDILEEITEANGARLYDSEYMLCTSCGSQALGPEAVQHADDCLVMRARRALAELVTDAPA